MITQEPPTASARWPLVRVHEGHTIQLQLLSSEWVRLVTHFYRSTFLCPEVEECAACVLLPPRPYWYLPVFSPRSSRSALVELSASASADLEQKVRFAGFAVRPGVKVELSRKTKKAAIRVEVLGQAETPPVARLHEWVTPLMAIFGLPAIRPGESLQDFGVRVKHVAIERAKVRADAIRGADRGRLLGR